MTKPDSTPVTVVIVAAGSGLRFGAPLPKQFCMMGGQPVLCHTIARFRKTLPKARIITVISPDASPIWSDILSIHPESTTEIVYGGSTRWESVKNALDRVEPEGIVLIHDGARPLVDGRTINSVIKQCRPGRSVIPVYPVTDSLRLLDADGGNRPVDRASFRSVSTPQGFMAADLKVAYRLPYSTSFTDDASVMAAASMSECTLVDTPAYNFKITNPCDIAMAEWYLNNPDYDF